MYRTQENAIIDSKVAVLVLNDRIKFSFISHDRNSCNNSIADEFSSEMLKNKSY